MISDTYIKWSAQLIEAGQNFLGVSAAIPVARSLRMDAEAGAAPGRLFKTMSRMIGGRGAEPLSHIAACEGCLRELWTDETTSAYRQPATGFLLRQLIRERGTDYGIIIRTLLHRVRYLSRLVHYILGWAIGHFIVEAINAADTAATPHVPSKKESGGGVNVLLEAHHRGLSNNTGTRSAGSAPPCDPA